MSARMVRRVNEYAWRCKKCKICIKCRLGDNDDKMLFCDQCDRSYHIYCIGLRKVPNGKCANSIQSNTFDITFSNFRWKDSKFNTISFSHSFQANGIVRFVWCVHFAVHDVPKAITIRIWRNNKSKNCWPWPNGRTNIKRIQWQKSRSIYRCSAHRVWQSSTVQLKMHTSIELEQNPETREEERERESDKINAEMLLMKKTQCNHRSPKWELYSMNMVNWNQILPPTQTTKATKCPHISIENVQLNVQQQQKCWSLIETRCENRVNICWKNYDRKETERSAAV